MIDITFNDGVTCKANFRRTSTNIITLIGEVPSNTSGFKAYSKGKLLGDYSAFTTIYKSTDEFKMFSNNGSVEPTREVEITATWVGGENEIPNTILINTNREVGTLSKPDWKKTYTIHESENFYLVDSANLDKFSKIVSAYNVTYTYLGDEDE